ncbi:Gfo/Idh/MocA family oxidoreductase, partial [Streptomyces olivaceoviridis]
PQFVLFETERGALVDVEVFVNSGFGYQVRCEAVCEAGSARIGDEHTMVVTTRGGAREEVAQDYLVRFADAYDREVQAWVDATRRGEVTGPDVWDGYAASAVAEAGVRALRTGGRVAVDLAPRPDLYATAGR